MAKYDYGAQRLLSLKHPSEGRQYYHFDALGSPITLTKTDGSVQARYQYDAWGHYRQQTGNSHNRFGFTGHEHDKSTGLIYAKARYYDPDTGRFLSQDSWTGDPSIAPSLHKYLYAYQNPTVYVDPDGNAPVFNETAEGLSDLADEIRNTADALENNGINTFSSAAIGLGAGLLDVLSFGTEVINQGVNLTVSALADENSGSLFVQESLIYNKTGTLKGKNLVHPNSKLNADHWTDFFFKSIQNVF